MQIADYSQDLKEYIRKQYEQRISDLLLQAKQERDQIVSLYEKQAHEEIKRIRQAADQRTNEYRIAHTSDAHAEFDRQRAKQEQKAVAQVETELQKRIAKLPSKKKDDIVHALHKGVIKALKTMREKPENYKVSVWSKSKIRGAKKNLSDLAVRAEADHLLIEDSVSQRLEQVRPAIIEHVTQLLGGRK